MIINRLLLPLLLPLAVASVVALWAGGIGILFIALYATDLGEWGAVIIGTLIVFLVPAVGVGITRRSVRDEQRKQP